MQHTKKHEYIIMLDMWSLTLKGTRKRNKVLSKQTCVTRDLGYDEEWDGKAMTSYCKHDPVVPKTRRYKKSKI